MFLYLALRSRTDRSADLAGLQKQLGFTGPCFKCGAICTLCVRFLARREAGSAQTMVVVLRCSTCQACVAHCNINYAQVQIKITNSALEHSKTLVSLMMKERLSYLLVGL